VDEVGATGGLARHIVPFTSVTFDLVDDLLTLRGLRILFALNA